MTEWRPITSRDDRWALHSGLYDAEGNPIPAMPAAGAPRAGTGRVSTPRATYAIDPDQPGRLLEFAPDGRLRRRTDRLADPLPDFSTMEASTAFAGRAMRDFQRVLFGLDDTDIHDDYINLPDPPPAYLYR